MQTVTSCKREMGPALLLERSVRSIYAKRGPAEMHPGQWSALRYFARANRSSRTVSGLAKFLEVTRGPASRAAKSLLKNELIVSEANKNDLRSPIFSISPRGAVVLKEDPMERLAHAISTLDQASRASLVQSLEHLSTSLEQ